MEPNVDDNNTGHCCYLMTLVRDTVTESSQVLTEGVIIIFESLFKSNQ